MKTKLILLFLLISASIFAQNNRANFQKFEYQGKDVSFKQKIDPKKQFFNPILPGFYPDPSICRKGKDYYLVNSSFSYFPGIPIFHSSDLVNWKQIGHVLDRPSQLNLDKLDLSGGIYAPSIEYNKENDTFYLITTLIGKGGNFIVKAKNPAGPWSDPIWIPEIQGIDPSISFMEGKSYIVYNGNPEGGSTYDGHKAIWIQEFDTKTEKVTGSKKMIVNGGSDLSKKPIWIEGPHLYKIGNYFFLMAAEGGTGFTHSEVIFRSKNVLGDYLPYQENPILTQRDLPDNRPNKITCSGHADLIQTPEGDWFAVFLACRPYQGNLYNTGRETFILPVKWKNGFPVLLKKGKAIPTVLSIKGSKIQGERLSGNFVWRDNFETKELGIQWNMLRTPREKWWNQANNQLQIEALPKSLSEKVNPAFIGHRQQHQIFDASVEMDFTPTSEKELAGLVLFQNDRNYLLIGKTLVDGKEVLVLQNRVNGVTSIVENKSLSEKSLTGVIQLQIQVNQDRCSFYYAGKDGKKYPLKENLDITHLSTEKAKGFVGSYIGMYVTSINL